MKTSGIKPKQHKTLENNYPTLEMEQQNSQIPAVWGMEQNLDLSLEKKWDYPVLDPAGIPCRGRMRNLEVFCGIKRCWDLSGGNSRRDRGVPGGSPAGMGGIPEVLVPLVTPGPCRNQECQIFPTPWREKSSRTGGENAKRGKKRSGFGGRENLDLEERKIQIWKRKRSGFGGGKI